MLAFLTAPIQKLRRNLEEFGEAIGNRSIEIDEQKMTAVGDGKCKK